MMKKYNSTGLSLPNELIEKIDSERGDVSRSRFLLRLIERAYLLKQKENGGSIRI
jgi:metal-responsive CopG/Arc/MetJ family transcriptional regulator